MALFLVLLKLQSSKNPTQLIKDLILIVMQSGLHVN